MSESKSKIFLSAPDLDSDELTRVMAVFESNWIAPLGPEVDAFEQDLASYCQRSSVAALSSGTAALHLALLLLGIGPGDRVVVPSFTFVASANPVKYLGAEPIFIDSEPETWNISPDCLREHLNASARIGELPKAVIIVDLYGMPARYDLLLPLCQEFGVPVIEDAAEALGSTFLERPAGSFGELSIVSFNGNKIITTSGGGALLANDSDLIKRARFLSTQARDAAPHYQHSEIGFNYRMSNVLAAIGRGQLARLEHKVNTRRSHFERYRGALESKGVVFPVELPESRCNRWLTTVLFPIEKFGEGFREQIRVGLEKENIESRPLWKPLHLQPVFAKCVYAGEKVAEKFFEIGLCLPSGSGLASAEIDHVIDKVLKLLP